QAGHRLPGRLASLIPYARFERLFVDEADATFASLEDYDAMIGGIRWDFETLAALKREGRRDRRQGGDWSNSLFVQVALVRAPIATERNIVLQRIYRMSEDEFRQFWIAKMFRADVASGPKIVYSSEMARELVNAIPGAITFMPLDAARGMKILSIDGKRPGDPDYPLR